MPRAWWRWVGGAARGGVANARRMDRHNGKILTAELRFQGCWE